MHRIFSQLLAGWIPPTNKLTSLLTGRPPGPRHPVGRDDTLVQTHTPAAHRPLTTRPAPPRAPRRGAASPKTTGWEVLSASWGHNCSPSWTSRLKPGGGQGASWAFWRLRAIRLLSPSRRVSLLSQQRRVSTRTASLTSSYLCRPTSAGTNHNMETIHCSGTWVVFWVPIQQHIKLNWVFDRSLSPIWT